MKEWVRKEIVLMTKQVTNNFKFPLKFEKRLPIIYK